MDQIQVIHGKKPIEKKFLSVVLNNEELFIDYGLLNALNCDDRLTFMDRMVVLELVWWFVEKESPEQSHLAQCMNVSKRGLRNSLNRLEKTGWIKREIIHNDDLFPVTKFSPGEHLIYISNEVL